ncbi:hypothetical protein [Burkholderia pyrrocinia]|uniref:hypothetical protein n=1 Tax=Burkholderia pyrrocinia TaxID=60550 RepID=UPI001589526B|nr:hypothetical protein [Burkholderia pyrrocinia]
MLDSFRRQARKVGMGIKLKATHETEVYISQGGYLAISQDSGDGEDAIVILSPEQARVVAKEIMRQLEDTSWWDESISTDNAE